MGFTQELDALLTLAMENPLSCLRWIQHIREQHWCMHVTVWNALDTLECWAIEQHNRG